MEDHPSAWALITHLQDLQEAAGSWTQLDLALVISATSIVSQWVEDFCLSFFKLYLFLLQRQHIDREKERKRDRNISSLLFHSTSDHNGRCCANLKPGTLPGLPHRSRVPRLWAVPDSFTRPQVERWMGSRTAGIITNAHLGSWQTQGEDFSCKATSPGPVSYLNSHLALKKKYKNF